MSTQDPQPADKADSAQDQATDAQSEQSQPTVIQPAPSAGQPAPPQPGAPAGQPAPPPVWPPHGAPTGGSTPASPPAGYAPPPAAPPAGYAGSYPPPGYPAPGYPAPGYPGYMAPQTSTMAIVGLVLSIVSWFLCPVIPAVVALVLAQKSAAEINASGGRISGEGLNTATKIISWINIGLYGLIIVGFGLVFLVALIIGGAPN